MGNLREQEEDGTFRVEVGANITDTIAEAIAHACRDGSLVRFEFNGVTVRVRRNSDPKLIHRDYLRALKGYIPKKVGPYTNSLLTDEEKASDARIEAENELAWL